MHYFCVVKFLDNNKTFVVRSTDVKDFCPTHPEDFLKEKKYSVIWQEADGSFDGSYEAHILCQAATLEELKTKTVPHILKKMPANFNNFTSPPHGKKPIGTSGGKRVSKPPKNLYSVDGKSSKETPLVTAKRNPPSENSEYVAKKKRMMESLSQLKDHQGQVDMAKPCQVKCSSDEDDSQPLFPDDLSQDFQLDNILNNIDKLGCGTQDETQLLNDDDDDATDIEDGISTNDVKPVDDILSISDDSSDLLSGSEDEVSKLMSTIEKLKQKLHMKTKEMKNISSEHSKELKALEEKRVSDISLLRTSIKVAEKARLQQFSELEQARMDVTTLLKEKKQLMADNLRLKSAAEHQQQQSDLKEENRKLREVNRKLQGLIKKTQDLLSAGLLKFSNNETSKPAVKHLEFTTPSKISATDFMSPPSASGSSSKGSTPLFAPLPTASPSDGPKTPLLSDSPSEGQRIPEREGSPILKVSPSSASSCSSKSKKKVVKKVSGLVESQIDNIAEVVRKDISNEEPMKQDSDGHVLIGGGLMILKSQWDHIKLQSKNSLFIKKIGHCTYGPKGLKERFVGSAVRETKEVEVRGKKQATPTKVDAMIGCLRGRLLAQHCDKETAKEKSEMARHYLAEKMKDEARFKDPSKQRNTNN